MASAGMPCSAAARVTSGSFAAPSSIEYSVCTCRCTKESFPGLEAGVALLTGGRAPRWSCVPGRRLVRRATGGEDRRVRVSAVVVPGGAPILALPWVYTEGLTERVPHRPQGSH